FVELPTAPPLASPPLAAELVAPPPVLAPPTPAPAPPTPAPPAPPTSPLVPPAPPAPLPSPSVVKVVHGPNALPFARTWECLALLCHAYFVPGSSGLGGCQKELV